MAHRNKAPRAQQSAPVGRLVDPRHTPTANADEGDGLKRPTSTRISAPLCNATVAVEFSQFRLTRPPALVIHCIASPVHDRTSGTGSHALFFAPSDPHLCRVRPLRVSPRCLSCPRSCVFLPECCLECLCEGVHSCPLGSTMLFRACECRYALHPYKRTSKKNLSRTCTTAVRYLRHASAY